MEKEKKLEVWLRGPLPNVPAPLQPVAHALFQAQEEVSQHLTQFPDHLLWEKPAGVASVGFHLQHLTGVLDRLFTYARAQTLSPEAMAYLQAEGKPQTEISVQELVQAFRDQVGKAVNQLKNTDPGTLYETRGVGRAQVPSTVAGLLFHAAEHTQRHVGQLLVTSRVLLAEIIPENKY
ncbi:DinB family protein [Rufibacter latericius]|uniref:DinB family protein n=1 Tax=Rufibacter latericius TaxID=2487040 RepID=A0A3M9MZ98_9BACT|nr:DinB family protein [Rufibacter latericius]RNI30475.1 DinB family protein [Rufibacter latericius]